MSDQDSPGSEPPPTILVVDDEPLAREVLSDILSAQGFAVSTAEDAESLLAVLDGADLVLLDGMLPGRDGWDLCREIKERRGPLFPVIMVTARTAPEDIVRTFAAGADDYIPKPFNVAELTARVRSRIRNYQAERALQSANRRLADLAEQNYQLYEQARRDAEERALLLRELDHRVRNNLSVILGLVGMERNRRPSRPSETALASLESRLRSFLLVHEALRRHGYGTVPIRQVTERLALRLRGALDPERRIAVRVEGDVADLDERRGFALALAVNELVTNAFEHGFPDERPGELRITFREDGERISVEVSDDGVGPGRAAEKPMAERGSGRSIVRALAEGELGGRLEIGPADPGTRARIVFSRGTEGRREEAAPPLRGGS